jgi:UDP-N-acetylmuramoyl-L-alanyl-D-glutamate--2,6-diaminopimelate ligase
LVNAVQDIAAVKITGLAVDSRKVEPGFLFAALPGSRADGRMFIDDAIRRGAVAVLAPPGTRLPARAGGDPGLGISLIVDENPRRRLAIMAARFFQRQPETMAAVTGTNGKTSVVRFLAQIWTGMGRRAASLGTLGVAGPAVTQAGSLTTPDPVQLHRILRDLADDGVDCAAMEASSHGLDQCRLDGVRIQAAAFTNLGRDHLDYHGTIDAYRRAKLRLFGELLAEGGVAVINADSPEAETFAAAAHSRGARILTYGLRGRDVRLSRVEPYAAGQRLVIEVAGLTVAVELPMVGDFQWSNALAALALAIGTGADAGRACALLGSLQGVPGRLQPVAMPSSGPGIFVDYAHTPDALQAALSALRRLTKGKLVVVFGCGGDRDRGKRPEMGAIAAAGADRVIVTDDNPRSEDPALIRKEILAACPDALEISDRREAITAAVASLRTGDVLLIAGKGHETGQLIGDRVLPFDDVSVARAAARDMARESEQ